MAQTVDQVSPSTDGGQFTYSVAAATAGLAFTGPGRLCKIHAVTAGSAVTPIYDNTSATGTPICSLPATPVLGVPYNVQIPFSTGIYIGGGTNTSSCTVAYNKSGVAGVAPNVSTTN